MNKIFWGLVGVVLIGFFVIFSLFGVSAKTVTKIKVSQVKTPAEFAEGIAKRLYLEIKNSPVVMLGLTPGDMDQAALIPFLTDSLKKEGVFFDTIVVDTNLGKDIAIQANESTNIRQVEVVEEGLRNAKAANKKVMIITGNVFASQMVENGVARQLKAKGFDILSIAMARFPNSREEENQIEIRCDTPVADTEGTGHLGCAVLQMARSMYRKARLPDHFTGRLDLAGENDYILLYQRNMSKL